MRQVLIIHGWSDTSSSFKPLVKFLRKNGYQAITLWLGDYRSLDDDVRVEDVGKRLEQVIREKMTSGELTAPFDIIVHSTGGLVAREWISAYYADDIAQCPVKRLIMLAPANFGSRLASLGKSMLGRLVKGWNNWFHTGTQMLNALELSSPYQWSLAQRDLFIPEGKNSAPAIYAGAGIFAFVITGTHPYTSALRRVVNEDGSDGTVRVPAANLNVHGVTIDFAACEDEPLITNWKLRYKGDIPLAVLPDRTHSSVVTPQKNEVKSKSPYCDRLGELLLQALACDGADAYQAMANQWREISEETAKAHGDRTLRNNIFRKAVHKECLHQYLQVNVRVVDDHGIDVADYFVEFSGPEEEKGDESSVYFHREVLEHVHENKLNKSYRCFYVDRTDLLENYYNVIPQDLPRVLYMSISASPPGDNVSYFGNYKIGARGVVPLHFESEKKTGKEKQVRWLKRNSTHFVKIIIPRTPKEKVFKMKKG